MGGRRWRWENEARSSRRRGGGEPTATAAAEAAAPARGGEDHRRRETNGTHQLRSALLSRLRAGTVTKMPLVLEAWHLMIYLLVG